MIEIEKKYLVDRSLWEAYPKPEPARIVQGYLHNSKEKTVRIRIKNDKAFLTIKGQSKGISRVEFEYSIPVSDAEFMLNELSGNCMEKLRYSLEFEGMLWEIDEFQGELAPLILAEIELNSEDQVFELPPWVTKDVSEDPNYFNANLIKQLK